MTINESLRSFIIQRARNCCEYCRIGNDERMIPFHVDHIVALKHGGTDEEDNLCYSCYKCNTFKGPNVAGIDPQTNQAAKLFNPREQIWEEHFQFDDDGVIIPLTPEARTTVLVLRMNDSSRVKQRKGLIAVDRYPCT